MNLLKLLVMVLAVFFVLFVYGFVFPYMISAEDSVLAFSGIVLAGLFTVGLLYLVCKFAYRLVKEHC